MKKLFTIIITFVLSTLLVACNSSSTNMFYFEIDKTFDGYVTMVTEAGYPPYENLVQKDGKWTIEGVDIEIAKEIAKAMKKNLRVIDKDFDFLISDVQTGKADFALAGITPTAKRLEQVDFSNSYFTEANTQVVLIHKDNIDKYKNLEDINKKDIAIGMQLGSLQETLANTLAPLSIKKPNGDLNLLLQDLSSKKIEAIFTESSTADTHINGEFKNLHKAFFVESDYSGNAVAVKKGFDQLSLINEVIENLKDSGKIDQWLEYYIGQDTPTDNKVEKPFLDFSFLLDSEVIVLLLRGLLMTVLLAIVGVGIGFLFALIPAFMRLSNHKYLSIPAGIFVDIVRGTPMLVQIFILYYAMNLPVIPVMGVDLGSLIPGIIALIINCSAYISEIIRGGILSVSKGQTEAARSLGLSSYQTMRRVVLPQAIKNILPSLGNEFVTIIKETSIFVVVGIAELMYQINVIKAQTWKMLEVYIVAGVLYLILTLPLSKLMLHFEKRMNYEK